MTFPNITTSTINVELTDERSRLITQKLAPLARLFRYEQNVDIKVVIRGIAAGLSGEQFYVSVKVTTSKDTYMAVATGHYLTRTLASARDMLRKSISRGASVNKFQAFRVPEREQAASYTLAL